MQQQINFLDLLSGKTCQEPLAATKEKTFKQSSKRFVASGGGQDHIVPLPPKNKWLPFGTIVGDGWSVAWRVYDAQFWGVPQRRKRIYLIADFGSERAGEILSECESMCGYPAQSGEAREGTAADVKGSTGRSDYACGGLTPWEESAFAWTYRGREGCCNVEMQKDVSYCLREPTGGGSQPNVCYPAAFMGGQGAKARSIAYCEDGSTPTLKSTLSGGNTVPDVVYAVEGNTVDRESNKNGKGYSEDVSPTLNTQDKHAVCYPDKARSLCARHDSSPCIDRGQNFICVQNTGRGWWNEGEVAETLRTPCGGDSTKANLVIAIDCRNMCVNEELSATIQAKNEGGHSLNFINPVCYRQDGFAGYSEGVGTLKASGGDMGGVRKASSLSVYENHGIDARYTGPMEVCPTITQYAGTGGNNLPIAVQKVEE